MIVTDYEADEENKDRVGRRTKERETTTTTNSDYTTCVK